MIRSLVALALASMLIPACSSGGGDGSPVVDLTALFESESNDTAATANTLPLGRPGSGDLTSSTDVDFWSFTSSAGDFLTLELFANRMDHPVWDAVNGCCSMTLLASDGTTELLRNDPAQWQAAAWGMSTDLDILRWRAPTTGTYFIRLNPVDMTGAAVAGGKYAVRVTQVDVGTLQFESEAKGASGANDTAATAQAITPGTLFGWHVDDESDFYSFSVPADSIVRFEILAYRLRIQDGDDDDFAPMLRLIGTDGATILQQNINSNFEDSTLSYYVLTAGTYYVQVMEAGGTGAHEYFLEFSLTSGTATESESNNTTGTANPVSYGSVMKGSVVFADADIFSFSGTAGDRAAVRFFTAGTMEGAGMMSSLVFVAPDGTTVHPHSGPDDALRLARTILTQTGTWYVSVATAAPAGGANYAFELLTLGSAALETEPNDAFAEAISLGSSGRASGVISSGTDADRFSFTAVAGELVALNIHGGPSRNDGYFNTNEFGSALSPVVTVRNASDTVLATSTNDSANVTTESLTGGGYTVSVAFIAPSAGNYQLRIADANGTGSATHSYVIEKR